jgi:UDP-glucose 4-epimerase
VADPSLAEKLLNWKAKRSLEQIIGSAWAWAKKTKS